VRAGAFGIRVQRGPGEPPTSGADSAAEDAVNPDAVDQDAFGAEAFDLADPDKRSLAEVIARCAALRTVTGGAFDPWAVPGGFDPSGLVKGWAADRVADLLVARGLAHVSVDAGGDVVTRGRAAPGRPWSIGVRHPADRQAIVATVTCGDTCVATSGTSERGEHVIDPRTRRPAAGAWAATVVGPDAGIADALATALLVDGRDGLAWFAGMPGWSAFVADAADAGTAWSVGPAFGQR
jgi:thiamine biosynthesis lipoprotein